MQLNNSYRFFQNKECEWFPCHSTQSINCMFCFCPLYHLDCNGNYKTLENGIKDCSDCLIPHSPNGYDYIIDILKKENNSKMKG